MSARYTQSKSEQAAHAAILKSMLKRPENRLCADCKRNDPRWASCNLGCFICIRCSGIHRGMGVHISRIKSVDLDTWTPEQIQNIQRWGNKRANAYWEAHLKPGHIPPEHKIESFIRSKYDSKRWALEGPVPEPETLDSDAGTTLAAPVDDPVSTVSSAQAPGKSNAGKAMPTGAMQTSSLLDIDFSQPSSSSTSSQQRAQPPKPKQDSKADILSLFASNTTSAPQAVSAPRNNFATDDFAAFAEPQHATAPSFSTNHAFPATQNQQPAIDLFGDFSSAPANTTTSQVGFGDFDAPNVWGGSSQKADSGQQKDAFADIWS